MELDQKKKYLDYLPYCSHDYHHYEESEKGTERSCCQHHCFCLHPAETGHYALSACLQMLLCYYRFPQYDQESIAHLFDLSGKATAELVAQIQSVLARLTCGHFEPKFHQQIDQQLVKTEIATNLRPFMVIKSAGEVTPTSNPGWSFQICAGFREGSSASQSNFSLHIFDPLPTPIGKVFYEHLGGTEENGRNYLGVVTLERRKEPGAVK